MESHENYSIFKNYKDNGFIVGLSFDMCDPFFFQRDWIKLIYQSKLKIIPPDHEVFYQQKNYKNLKILII